MLHYADGIRRARAGNKSARGLRPLCYPLPCKRVEWGNFSNAVEVTVMLAETEMGGVSEPRGLVVESTGLLGELRRLLDAIHASIMYRDGCSRAFDDCGAGACGHCEKQGCGYG